ncbi:unnamed protein product [Blumeria hordei]|uniref:Uncharacterized protein n=1 Tax=Blumeria hordei TaxID=2867405 RepID=A0A383UGB4_BLUHO|nr:unnamed protein product [Blumeria hordei]
MRTTLKSILKGLTLPQLFDLASRHMTIFKPLILKFYNYMANIDVEIINRQVLQRKLDMVHAGNEGCFDAW